MMTTAAAAATLSQSIGSIGDAQSAQAQAALKLKGKTKAAAQQFEAMFLNSMFQQMYAGLQGDGPFGNSTGVGPWRSFLTEEYAKSFVKAGGVGIADSVYKSLLTLQEARAK